MCISTATQPPDLYSCLGIYVNFFIDILILKCYNNGPITSV